MQTDDLALNLTDVSEAIEMLGRANFDKVEDREHKDKLVGRLQLFLEAARMNLRPIKSENESSQLDPSPSEEEATPKVLCPLAG